MIAHLIEYETQVWKFWLGGVATVITGGLGVVGNALSLVVLCSRLTIWVVEFRYFFSM